jgi:hypothetical protein
MCVIVNLHFDTLFMNHYFESHTHISYVDQTKCKVLSHTKYFKGCSCFVMSFGARTKTFPPHDASLELPTLAFTFWMEGLQVVFEGSHLELAVLEGSHLELAVLVCLVIYVMRQQSIQRGHFGPTTIQSSYNDVVRLIWPNHL